MMDDDVVVLMKMMRPIHRLPPPPPLLPLLRQLLRVGPTARSGIHPTADRTLTTFRPQQAPTMDDTTAQLILLPSAAWLLRYIMAYLRGQTIGIDLGTTYSLAAYMDPNDFSLRVAERWLWSHIFQMVPP